MYTNYSIIFTEISFFSEISILLQKITNNSYDISDMNKNFNRKGGQYVYSESERYNATPTENSPEA